MTLLYSNEQYLESKDFLFHIDLYRVDGGFRIPAHSHEFVELAFIADGKGMHAHEGESYSIDAGDVFVIEPGAEHAYEVEEGNFLDVINVLFVPSLLSQELAALTDVTSFIDFYYMEPFLRADVSFQAKLTLNPHQRLELREVLERLAREYKRKESGYRFLIKTKLIEIFILLSRTYENNRRPSLASLGGDREIIERVCAFITRHYANPMTLEQVSQMAGMSQSKFTSLFRSVTGKTFLEYRNAERIGMAKRLLATTNDKILQIALDIGFDDASHFNRVFKQETEESPSRYRKRMRAEM